MPERFTPFDPADLDARQRQVFDDIASGPRGTVPWIFHLYLNSPELASRVQQLGAFCRYGTSLPPRLSELAILVVARYWKADYEWAIHAGEARKAGLSDELIAAIEAGRRPAFDDPDAELLYDFATAFFAQNDVPDALFAKAIDRFGRKTTVEFAGILGYYSMLAIAIRIFRLPPEPYLAERAGRG
jgi:4-carboxymuconolactone decarboxylase